MKYVRVATLSVSLVATCIVVGVLDQQRARTEDEPDTQTTSAESANRWEYLVIAGGTTNTTPTGNASMRKEPGMSSMRESFPVESNLDRLGARGWELVSVGGAPGDPMYYMKRRK